MRWTGTLTPTESGTHTLAVQSDDGARLWIGDRLVVDDWGDHDVRRRSGVIQLTAGQARRMGCVRHRPGAGGG